MLVLWLLSQPKSFGSWLWDFGLWTWAWQKCYFELFFVVLYVFLLQMSNSVMDKNIYSIKSSMLNFVLGLLAPDRVLLSKLPNWLINGIGPYYFHLSASHTNLLSPRAPPISKNKSPSTSNLAKNSFPQKMFQLSVHIRPLGDEFGKNIILLKFQHHICSSLWSLDAWHHNNICIERWRV